MTNKELFYFIGRCLTLDENKEFKSEIIRNCQSGLFDWERFVSICSNHFILQVIYIRFRTNGILGFVPVELVEHLQEIYELNVVRNQLILEQIEAITELLNQNNIYPVYLKGAAYLLDGLYEDIGERILGDIDFLVPEENYLFTAALFEREGYTKFRQMSDYEVVDEMKHYPRLLHSDFIAVIEIHRLPVDEGQLKWFNSEIIKKENKKVEGSLDSYVLSDKHKIIHNFIHSQLINEGSLYGIVSLKELFDLYLLSKRFSIEESLSEIKPKQKAIAYFGLARLILGLDNLFFQRSNIRFTVLKTKHKLNQNSTFFYKTYSSIVFIYQRIIIGYLGQILIALFSKKKRTYIKRRIKDSNWFGDHKEMYARFFRRKLK